MLIGHRARAPLDRPDVPLAGSPRTEAPSNERAAGARRALSLLAGLLVLSCLMVGCGGGQEQVSIPESSRADTGSSPATSSRGSSTSRTPSSEPGAAQALGQTAICDSVAVADVAAASTMPVARSRAELYADEPKDSGVVRCEYGYEIGSKSVGFVSIGVNPNTTLEEVSQRADPNAQQVTVAGAPGLFYEGDYHNGLLKVSTSGGLLEIEIRGTIGPPSPTTAEPYVAVAELTMTNLRLS